MKKVLVVDDEPRIVKFLSLKLTASGFNVTAAENGIQALEQLKKMTPDVILMDIIMPGMDGVETLRQLRKTCHCPVIMFSAREHDFEEIKKLGADDYIRKPFDPEEVAAKLHQVLNGHK